MAGPRGLRAPFGAPNFYPRALKPPAVGWLPHSSARALVGVDLTLPRRRRSGEARLASTPEWRSGPAALGGSGQAACGGRAGKADLDASLLALGRKGFRPRRLGTEMLEPGPSGTGARRFVPLRTPSGVRGQARFTATWTDAVPQARRWALDLGDWQRRSGEIARAATLALVSSGSAGPRAWPRPIDPAASTRACPEGRLQPLLPASCWQSRGRTAGAWGRSPRAAGSPQLLAPPKMTICHSIKVSGQLMGEPGSATPGQNGLLPRIGEVQMLNAEHCALSQSAPHPTRPQVRRVDSSGVKGSGH